MKHFSLIAILFAMFAFSSCNQNEPTKHDDTQKNQPANPATWSPAGHRYAYTYEDGIKSVYCYERDSIFSYQTPNDDYSIDEDFEYINKWKVKYSLDYPTITIYNVYTIKMTFIDTTHIYFKGMSDEDYYLID